MPMYSFKCTKCMNVTEVMRPMSESDEPCHCSRCAARMRRNFQADLFHTSDDSYKTPLVSDSLAVNMDQIDEHKQAFPDVEITKEGQPVFRSYTQHEAYLKKVGFVKDPKKKRLNEKKVTTISK